MSPGKVHLSGLRLLKAHQHPHPRVGVLRRVRLVGPLQPLELVKGQGDAGRFDRSGQLARLGFRRTEPGRNRLLCYGLGVPLGLERCGRQAPEQPAQAGCRPAGVPTEQAREGQDQLKGHGFGVLAVVGCDHGDSPGCRGIALSLGAPLLPLPGGARGGGDGGASATRKNRVAPV